MLLAALWALSAEAAAINGHSYTALDDWAAANGLRLVRTGHSDEFVVTNRTARLVFEKNSVTAEINGVNVALSFPVGVDRGEALVAQLDLTKAVEPLLFPAWVAGKKITTICLDPGHGGKDTGNRVGGFFGHSEKTYTLALALELRDQLKKAGFNVLLTRSKDEFVELPVRPAMANKAGADLFVSLHFNAFPAAPKSVEGPETYCITPVGAASSNAQGEGSNHGVTAANHNENKSLLLAYQVQKALVRSLGAEDRSVRRARFAVLRDAAMPAILVEGGYMTHPTEGRKIFDPAYRRQMAAAIVKAIVNYQKLTAPPAPAATLVRTNKVFTVKGAK